MKVITMYLPHLAEAELTHLSDHRPDQNDLFSELCEPQNPPLFHVYINSNFLSTPPKENWD